MIRVLHALPRLYPGGGIDSFFMNYFINLDHEKFHVDVICHDIEDPTYKNIVEGMGGKVFLLPKITLRNAISIRKDILKLLSQLEPYDIIHCNMANAAYAYLWAGRKMRIPVRILHSHQSEYADKLSHAIRNIPLIALGKKYANTFFAASNLAGDFLFKNEFFTVIPNAIDTKKYEFNDESRKNIRSELGFKESDKLIGCIGRLTPQKNQLFAVDVFAKICADKTTVDTNTYLIFFGDGIDLANVKKKVEDYNLEDRVLFMGNLDNIAPYYSALDLLLMPSLYEGLPLTLVESQSAGLPALVSSGVSREAKMTEFVKFLSLQQGPEIWAKVCRDLLSGSPIRSNGRPEVIRRGYDIHDAANNLEKTYMEKLSGFRNGSACSAIN